MKLQIHLVFVDITNLTATLTLRTSKFLITFNVSANANANQRGGIKVVRKIGRFF